MKFGDHELSLWSKKLDTESVEGDEKKQTNKLVRKIGFVEIFSHTSPDEAYLRFADTVGTKLNWLPSYMHDVEHAEDYDHGHSSRIPRNVAVRNLAIARDEIAHEISRGFIEQRSVRIFGRDVYKYCLRHSTPGDYLETFWQERSVRMATISR